MVDVLFLAPAFGTVPAGHGGVVLRSGAVTGRVPGEGISMRIKVEADPAPRCQ
jgi:hypothetical protein